jgi:hypothetical protein
VETARSTSWCRVVLRGSFWLADSVYVYIRFALFTFSFFLFFWENEVWNQGFHLQSRYSTTWTTSPVHLALVNGLGSHKLFALCWPGKPVAPNLFYFIFNVWSVPLSLWPSILSALNLCAFFLCFTNNDDKFILYLIRNSFSFRRFFSLYKLSTLTKG